MAEQALEVQSVSDLREAGIHELQDVDNQRSRQAKQLARRILLQMADGAPFTAEDFFFAATAGDYRRHDAEHKTLKILEAIEPGEVVGVVSAKNKLVSVGIAADTPMQLKVHASYSDRDISMPFYNSKLEASVHLQDVYMASKHDHQEPVLFYDDHTEVVLERYGERESFTRGVFLDPRTLLKGAEAVIQHIANERNDRDVLMVSGLLGNLGVRSFNA